jgi:hypothetical protein
MTTSANIHPLDGLHRLVESGAVSARIPPTGSPRPTVVGSDRASDLALLFAFLLGLGARLQVKFIGYLPLSEIAILLLFPFLIPRYTQPAVRQRCGWLLPLLAIWMVGAVASDLYRETDWSLAARGLGRIVVYISAVPFVAWFFYRDMFRKLLCFAAGTVPSMALSAFVLRGGVHEGRELVYGKAEISWKTHWSAVALLAAAFLALYFYRRSRLVAYASNSIIGGLNLALGSRSTGAISLLAVAGCAFKNRLLSGRKGRPARSRLVRSLLVAALIGGAAFGLVQSYSWLAESGQLGNVELAKYRIETKHELGLLGGGRVGYLVGGLIAVSESPFVGYGSWPLDKYGYYYRVCEFFNQKPDRNYYKLGYPLIPSHSHIVSAWVEHGILAIPFWIYAIFLSIRAILMPIGDSQRLQLWVMAAAAANLWNIPFSPISYRMEMTMTLVVFISQFLDWKRSRVGMPASHARFPAMTPAPSLPGVA